MQHGTGLFASIEQSGLALLIRDSLFLYPVANVAHVLAVLAFFAIVAAMDLALLGGIPGAEPFATKQRLRPFAILALGLVIFSGVTMFLAEAAAMARNTAFQLKMIAVLGGIINVLVLERLAADQVITRGVRRSAVASLIVWVLAAGLGRFIAYA